VCLELGAADFVSKPFDPVILRAKINGCLARKRLHDSELEYQRMVKEQAAQVEELNRELARRVRDRVAKAKCQARLRRFLPSRLVEAGVGATDDVTIDPRCRDVCLVSARLCGLDAVGDGIRPEAVLALLRQFHVGVDGLAAAFEATVVSSAGDAATAVFGDVLPSRDPAVAVRFGLALAAELGPLVQDFDTRSGAALAFGVGVGRGRAFLGGVDIEGRCDYVALGGAVERAAALAQQGHGVVLVDDGVRHATADTVEFVAADPVHRGFAWPAYRVVGLRAVPPVPDASPRRH
jgi:adenylate cyclase